MRRRLLAVALVIGASVLWYLFRPERLFINKTVNETFAAATTNASAVARGTFHGVHHDTRGIATIFRSADGHRTVRFTDFMTSNGPDVRVYLVRAADASDNTTITQSGFVDLGAMKGNEGDQNYDVPDSIDLAKYRAVTVWCRRFNVNFATAPLTAASSVLAHGAFHSNAHSSAGSATIYDQGHGGRTLRLTEFATSNGPDVRIYLVAAPDVTDNATVTQAGFVDLGAMKGNQGDQNYAIPDALDLSKYRTVTIWCRRFRVNFGSAPLSAN